MRGVVVFSINYGKNKQTKSIIVSSDTDEMEALENREYLSLSVLLGKLW